MAPGIPLSLHAGIIVNGKTITLPLCQEGERFEFVDQTMTPTTMQLGGIDPDTGIHVKLTIRIPFRPRDENFSTTPAIFFDIEVEKYAYNFRWRQQKYENVEGEVFLYFSGKDFNFEVKDDFINAKYSSPLLYPEKDGSVKTESLLCEDRILVLSGEILNKEGCAGGRFPFSLKKGETGPIISLAWCSYDPPVLEVMGKKSPFKYTERFKSIEDVVEWCRNSYTEVIENSKKVDDIILNHNLGEEISHLLCFTLHSWLFNTWWVVTEEKQDFFTVWEGSCYFHSTIDVEFTQAPFYLGVWPELLELELNEWPYFVKDGSLTLGERGKETVFLSHDMGIHTFCSGQKYPHDMEVEESANYVILAFVHWYRTGKTSVIEKHSPLIRKLLDFIVACDTTGNGIPDKGCANTIDDAAPAIQYGSKQIYLGVKAAAACLAGFYILKKLRQKDISKYKKFALKGLSTIEEEGWLGDHYAVTISRTIDGLVDPWSGRRMAGELKGWDAYHIYTENTLALLDMIDFDMGLRRKRLIKDMKSALNNTLMKYGCRHTSYTPEASAFTIPGLAGTASKTGWVSMNMIRDIAAAYRGLDFLWLSGRYWDWQCTTNTREFSLFFETFYGNNLCFYPRGIAIFGILEAAVGFTLDMSRRKMKFSPLRPGIYVPVLILADWKKGTVPLLRF